MIAFNNKITTVTINLALGIVSPKLKKSPTLVRIVKRRGGLCYYHHIWKQSL